VFRARQSPVTAGAWTLLVLAAALSAGDWLAVARDDKRLEYVCKPGALAALIGVAVTLDPAHGDVRAWFVLALALSLAGDVFLMLPSDRFVAGLASFLPAIGTLWIDANPRTDVRDCLVKVSFRCICLAAVMKSRCVSLA